MYRVVAASRRTSALLASVVPLQTDHVLVGCIWMAAALLVLTRTHYAHIEK